MRFPADVGARSLRVWLIALLAGAALGGAAPAAQAAFGVESFFAGNCTVATCGEFGAPPPKESEFFTQAAGHPNFGITDFRFKSREQTAPFTAFVPEGNVERLQVDVPAGLSTNPQAVPQCSLKEFGEKEAAPGTGVFLESENECSAETQLGTDTLTVATEVPVAGSGVFKNFTLPGTVFNLEQPNGLSSDFGVEVSLAPLGKAGLAAHSFIEGHVEWSADYHEYFVIKGISKEPLQLVESRLVFKGKIPGLKAPFTGEFLTNPSSCNPPGPATTTMLHVKSYEGQPGEAHYTAPVGASGCNLVPFAPTFSVNPETTRSDQPDGVTTELGLPHGLGLEGIDTSTLRSATVTLPEGMTLNPSAAAGLEGCTPEQIGIGTTAAVACPEASKIGTVAIEVPTLPAKSLEGNIYLGKPSSGSITGPPYTIYLDATSERYGVSVRLEGTVVPDETTGRLTATFAKNPEAPFTDFILRFTGRYNGGPLSPLANPLVCGPATTETSLTPFSGTAAQSPLSSFTVDSNGSGGACPSPLPFTPTQTVPPQNPGQAGAYSPFVFKLERTDGQPYLSQIKTTLPAGLLGAIPSVTLCGEPQAQKGECTFASQIGLVQVTAGAGPSPYTFTGQAFLTGPYNGAPYGMSIVIPAVAGANGLFNLGDVVTRAAINVEPYTYRLVVSSTLPTIVKGIPLRLKAVTIAINRQNFLFNPTNCGVLATESTVSGFTPGSSPLATSSLSTPFQVSGCSTLPFKPSLTAFTGAKTSKANGASIEVKVTQAANQANIKQVLTTLPKQLPARGSTLMKACLAATFEVAEPPGRCSSESRVGGATATTPVLPGTLSGPAYLVSHGGEAFPDLDVILRGDGVTVVLVGHTHVSSAGVITTNFESLPDAPISSFSLNLPIGPHSVLAGNGNLCASTLTMPTTIVAQSGSKITQNTRISVTDCPVRIVGHRTSGTHATITVQAPAAGRISGSGSNLKFVTRHLKKAERATINVPLTRNGEGVLRKFHQLTTRVRVGFIPKANGGRPTSTAYVRVTFRS
jgi:hypothetical protein